MSTIDPSVDAFNQDAASNAGYVYTTDPRLSCRLAVQTHRAALLGMNRFLGRSVLDLGCGDGSYTRWFWDHGTPRAMVGVDAAPEAIAVADAGKGARPIRFEVADAHRVPFPDDSFDVTLVQSLLHHDESPWDLIREAFRLAPDIVVLEPNGYNPGLKFNERTSAYHQEHRERSYPPHRIDRWVAQAGGRVVRRRFAGFVPMFCPDWLARTMKVAEPVVERLPGINRVGCAVYVFVATRRGAAPTARDDGRAEGDTGVDGSAADVTETQATETEGRTT